MPKKGPQKNRDIALVCMEAFAAARMGKPFSEVVEYKGLLYTVRALKNGQVKVRQGGIVADVRQAMNDAHDAHLNRRKDQYGG
jgi:hypothetical protein